ncbi:MAG: tRNA-binding protein [Gemmatimonadales bacterium]|nr:MAG: tRNA-binding protein [Gemmatimonadales bacterium]
MPPLKPPVDLSTFRALDIRVGTVLEAGLLEGTRKPFLALEVEFGEGVGTLKSAAQLTRRYDGGSLAGRSVLAVVNLPPLHLPGFTSQCLVLGLVNPHDPGDVVLVAPDGRAANAGGADAGEASGATAPEPGWPLG